MSAPIFKKREQQQEPRPSTSPAPEQEPPSPLRLAQQAVQRHTTRPLTFQRQAVAPVLRAASLEQAEVARVQVQRRAVVEQLRSFPLGEGAPVQRKAELIPTKPQSPAEWVTVMRHQAEQVEGQALDTRQYAQFTALQRQVAHTLAQGFRSDRGPVQARYDTYGEHLATLQRHEISAPVSRVVLGMVPAGERLALQRAVDVALQRYEAKAQQEASWEQRQRLQRQLAELDVEATQPVLQRIQAKRGSGNPLPEAIQRHLEQGLNHDLSKVRIHDDTEADKLAKGVNSIAFTTGTDIFFQSGKFNPNTQSGLELLAHEVTHTVQQAQGRVGPGIDPDAGLEAEARSMGRHLANTSEAIKINPRPGRSHRLKVIGKNLGVQRKLSIQRALPVVAVWIGKTIVTGSIDNFIDYAIAVLLGLPAPGFWDKAGNFALNAIPGVGEAKKAKKIAELSSALGKVIGSLQDLEKLGDAGKSAAAVIRKRAGAFETAAKSGDLNTARTAWTQLIESIQNGHLVKARQLNMATYQSWATKGLTVGGQAFKVNDHFLNTLKKGGRKDIDPSEVIEALRSKPSSRAVIDGLPSVTYTNPKTGLRVFVNPDTKELVGVWPANFR